MNDVLALPPGMEYPDSYAEQSNTRAWYAAGVRDAFYKRGMGDESFLRREQGEAALSAYQAGYEAGLHWVIGDGNEG